MTRLALAAALALPLSAVAQTALDPVVVTATRTGQIQSQTLAQTLVIDRDEIERAGSDDLADLLRFYAGLEVDRAGGPGQLAQLRVRGGETDHVLLLVDGVKVNPASSGPTLQTLAPENIERIEIVKGPRSTLYGSEGISATINVITRGGARRFDALVRAGSFGTRGLSVGGGDQTADGGWSLQAGLSRSHGIAPCVDQNTAAGSDERSLAARGNTRLGPALTLSGQWLEARGEVDYMSFGCPSAGFSAPTSQGFHTQTVAATLEAAATPSWTSTLTLSRVLDFLEQRDSADFSRTTRPRADWNNVVSLGESQTVSAGVELEHERGEALYTGLAFVEDARDIAAVHAQDQVDLGRHHGLLAARFTHDSGFGDVTTWNAEYGFDVAARTRLVATAGSGYRAPTFLERSPGFFGNPDLKPERSRSYELGVRHGFGPGHWLDARLFRTDAEDLITGFPPQNVARARSQGVDLQWRGVLDAWSWLLTAVAQEPKDLDADRLLARRARRSLALKLDRRIGPHAVGIDVLASGRRTDTAFDPLTFAQRPVTLGGYTRVDLHGTLQLDPHLALQVTGQNLLNTHYATAYGYRQPGAAAYVSLRLSF